MCSYKGVTSLLQNCFFSCQIQEPISLIVASIHNLRPPKTGAFSPQLDVRVHVFSKHYLKPRAVRQHTHDVITLKGQCFLQTADFTPSVSEPNAVQTVCREERSMTIPPRREAYASEGVHWPQRSSRRARLAAHSVSCDDTL